MFCEFINEDVAIQVDHHVTDADGKIIKTYYKCSGFLSETLKLKYVQPCPHITEDNCLLRKMPETKD